MPKQDNMRIWSQVERTNPEHTKPVPKGRFKLTAICAQSQRKRATEVFGPCGIGWGVDPKFERYEFMDVGELKVCTYHGVLWFMDGTQRGEVPIMASIPVESFGKFDDEYSKKVSTNALTKGLSVLGFNADVFMGKFDDNQYVNAMTQEFSTENKSVVPRVAAPEALQKYKGHLERAASEGGTDVFREVWANTKLLSKEDIKLCREYIKVTPSEQTWLQEQKVIATATDERLGAESA